MSGSAAVGIEGIGYSLGALTVTNEQLQAENPNWDMSKTIERTGVASRPIAAVGQTALDLALEATADVFARLQISASDVDALIFCTQTPDHVLPPNSALLHGRLGMQSSVMAFDITHACSGFVYALGIARSLVVSGTARRVLVVTADTYSRLVHPLDRSIRPLFGDGAAATVVSGHHPRLKTVDVSFGTSGRHAERFIVKNGGARHASSASNAPVLPDRSGRIYSDDHIRMDGIGILSFFNNAVPSAVRDMLGKHRIAMADVSLFVFHQASRLALDGIARSLQIADDKMIVDMEDTGNLVSASIPVALARLIDRGAVVEGQTVVLCGFGVGLSWATALMKV
jgi:3-oxoacyl-[acyl-carrier-protein] synthase-3